jgi:uncharacterized protein (TIGR03118 family)
MAHCHPPPAHEPPLPVDDLSPAGERLADLPVIQQNLVSDGFVDADHIDPNLINPWGISYPPTGPFWISDAGAGVTTLCNGTGATVIPTGGHAAIVISTSEDDPRPGIPTGQVFNGATGGFEITANDHTASASFLFATINGTISGWNPTVDPAATVIAVDDGPEGAVYTGLAIASTDAGKLLYVADFANHEVAVYDSSFKELDPILDPFIPASYSPFNVQVLEGHLFVTFAQLGPDGRSVDGLGKGYVDEFDLDGTLLHRIASNGPLDAPWGLAIAPASFGEFAGDLLVGNFGDGTINVYDRETNAFIGKLTGEDGTPIQNDRLWTLIPGNGGTGGDTQVIYFTAGLENEEHGVFGSLTPAPHDAPMM